MCSCCEKNYMEKNAQVLQKEHEQLDKGTIWQASLFLLICPAGLVAASLLGVHVYSLDMGSNPSLTLRLLWMIECPVVILMSSFYRQNPNHVSYLKAVGQGLLGLPAGAIVNSLGAIILGAPVGTQYFWKTLNWSLLMSAFTFAPAATIYGSSWGDWHRVLAQMTLTGPRDYMICLPAYGAVIGAWFGAWPMPLDWEKPWQEWPICVSYGAILGYLVGIVASLGFTFYHGSRKHVKGD